MSNMVGLHSCACHMKLELLNCGLFKAGGVDIKADT